MMSGAGELGPMLMVLGVLTLVLVAFIRDWAPPDVIAMSAFCVLVILGLLSVEKAVEVFSNPAPITIGAMFILSAAWEKTGVIDWMGSVLNRLVSARLWVTLPVLMVVVASCSAFVNNTPVVAVFLPVLLGISRRKHLPASKLLIPLSYAAVLGGCCTLIGSSTNILVSGIAVQYGQPDLGMFEFAPMGALLAGLGIAYVWIFGPCCLPDRLSVTAVLGPQDRHQFLCHLLINPESPLVRQRLTDTELADVQSGFRIIEVRRAGTRVTDPINEIVVRPYDRVLVAVSSRSMTKAKAGEDALHPETVARLDVENLSVIKGAIVEGVVAPHSRLIGQSLKSARFRQTYGMLVLAVHRSGKNLSTHFQNVELEFGDTVLMLGPVSTFEQIRNEGDFMLLEDKIALRPHRWRAVASLFLLGGAVAVSSLTRVPIVFAAVAACVVAMWLKCIKPTEAYKSIEWPVIFMLYGMLAVGTAMETTGTAKWIADSAVQGAQAMVPPGWMPLVILSLFYLTGSVLTEVLSNNATAVVMAPIAINSALSLGLDPRPFVFAVAFSASAAFSTPIGYQTHMMVYGAGGYRFSDFLKFGLPLNIILWITASWFIPTFWPF
jgi:di/tricarboxylate transporter